MTETEKAKLRAFLDEKGYMGPISKDAEAVFSVLEKMAYEQAKGRELVAANVFHPKDVANRIRREGLDGPCTATIYNQQTLKEMVKWYYDNQPENKTKVEIERLKDSERFLKEKVELMALRDAVCQEIVCKYETLTKEYERAQRTIDNLEKRIKTLESKATPKDTKSIVPFSFPTEIKKSNN